MIETPYLLFLGDAPDPLAAKVAQGIRDWRPDAAVGQLRMAGCKADMGLPDMTLAEAAAAGAKTLVVGVANRGGVISPAWIAVLTEALAAGHGRRLRPAQPAARRAGAGRRRGGARPHACTTCACRRNAIRSPTAGGATGRRCLAVGTDCSVGKMYTALAMEREMRARGPARRPSAPPARPAS